MAKPYTSLATLGGHTASQPGIKSETSMKTLCLALLACLPLAAFAAGTYSKVNGSVRVEAGQNAGEFRP